MPVSPAYHPDPRHDGLGSAFYDAVEPADFPQTLLRFRNQRWAERIGLGELTEAEWLAHFGRFQPLPDNLPQPLALRYHGHQFQHYNPDLGDGRGFLFAQLRDETGRLLDLATKGSGQTPWSRRGDGRLTLKGGVREILATEMLEALGVYTSKSFSLIETGEALMRGDEPSPTRSSVLVRLGHSHVRFGTFQRFAHLGEADNITRLLDYSITTYWPEAADDPDPAGAFFERVCEAMAQLAAEWFVAGFVHGVLNTDNMVITGESFDYGPWRFLPRFDPAFTAAYFDETGLYAFGRQSSTLYWNLNRLAECIIHLSSQGRLVAALKRYPDLFEQALTARTQERLGLRLPQRSAKDSVVAFYTTMGETGLPFQRVFFDLMGGAKAERIAQSPHRSTYEGPLFAPVINALREGEDVSGVALVHPFFAGAGPVEMVIEQVEAIWAPIAARDDWSAFEQAVAAIRAMGEAYQPLFTPRRV